MKNDEQPIKQKESWVRAHKLSALAISISSLALFASIASATAGWLKFPIVARRLGVDKWLEDKIPALSENDQADNDESKKSNLPDEVVRLDFESDAYQLPLLVRVTWSEKSKTVFEIFNKKKPDKAFQTFSMETERPSIGFQSEEFGKSGNFLIIDDVNFDGYADFLVENNQSVCCVGYDLFKYDSYKGTFVADKFEGIFDFFAGYESRPKEREIRIAHHCPPGNLLIVYRIKEGRPVPVRYYDINIHGGKDVEVNSPEEVCGN